MTLGYRPLVAFGDDPLPVHGDVRLVSPCHVGAHGPSQRRSPCPGRVPRGGAGLVRRYPSREGAGGDTPPGPPGPCDHPPSLPNGGHHSVPALFATVVPPRTP